jgi:hypothetical protein
MLQWNHHYSVIIATISNKPASVTHTNTHTCMHACIHTYITYINTHIQHNIHRVCPSVRHSQPKIVNTKLL